MKHIFIILMQIILFLDVIDVVNDQLYGTDYVKDEDPKLYISEKSGRGPLNENWLQEYWNEVIIMFFFLRTL